MNLTTEFEVLMYSPAGFDYPTDSFCILIPQYELEMRRACLGRPLFDFMVASLTPYPVGVTPWNKTKQYGIGSVVVRNACTYISDADCNTNDPSKPNSDWSKFKRFTNDGCNELWEKFLRQIMAYKVFIGSLTSTTYRSGAGGMTVNAGDGTGTRAVNKTEMLTNLTQYNGFVKMTIENMEEWLRDNYKTYELPVPTCAGNCKTVSNATRRIAFRR